MNRSQLLKNIEEMELKSTDMKKELEEEKKQFPQIGEQYFFIDVSGVIENRFYHKHCYRFQIFKTREEAQNFFNVECAKKRVKDEIKRLNDGWTPNWKNDDESKYFITLVHNGLAIDSYKYSKNLDNSMYLKNNELALEILKSHRNDLFLILGQ